MSPSDLKTKDGEIYSLLELSKAINANKDSKSLFRIYEESMRNHMRIGRFALFMKDYGWECMAGVGMLQDLKGQILDKKIFEVDEESEIFKGLSIDEYRQFNLVIPISHKKKILAYLLLGDLPENTPIALLLDIPFVRTYTNLLVVAIENMRLAEKELEKQKLDHEIGIARSVQQNLVPGELPNWKGLRVGAYYKPHKQIGGDYYDFIEQEKGFYFCLADVSGKGVPAALFMSNVQAGLRVLAKKGLGISQIVKDLNRLLVDNGNGTLYVSLILGHYNYKENLLEYINAGHLPGYALIGDSIQVLNKGTTVLGEFDTLPFLEKTEILGKDLSVFVFSDGATEVRNKSGEEFGEDKAFDFFKKESRKDPSTLIQAFTIKLDQYRNKESFLDDLTLLAFKVNN